MGESRKLPVKKRGCFTKRAYAVFDILLQFLYYVNKDKLPIGAKQLRKKEARDRQTNVQMDRQSVCQIKKNIGSNKHKERKYKKKWQNYTITIIKYEKKTFHLKTKKW